MALKEATRTDVREPVLTPGTWEIDPSHSSLEFVARHLMVTKVRGSFREFSGAITISGKPTESSALATIQAASADTRDATRDEHLRSPDFFDVVNFPTLEFLSREVEAAGDGRWSVHGDLTVRGVTKPVVLDVYFHGVVASDPWGQERAGFSATTTVNREDFGLTWNRALESGGVLLGRDVRIELEVEAIRK